MNNPLDEWYSVFVFVFCLLIPLRLARIGALKNNLMHGSSLSYLSHINPWWMCFNFQHFSLLMVVYALRTDNFLMMLGCRKVVRFRWLFLDHTSSSSCSGLTIFLFSSSALFFMARRTHSPPVGVRGAVADDIEISWVACLKRVYISIINTLYEFNGTTATTFSFQ